MPENDLATGGDPQSMLRSSMAGLERRGAPALGRLTVQSLAEVDVFLLGAMNPDGKGVSGLLVRPRVRPDLFFVLTAMQPVTPEMGAQLARRLPPPGPVSPAREAAPEAAYKTQTRLPPTPGQASAPEELVVQGRKLAAETEERRRRKSGKGKGAGRPVAPGSINLPDLGELDEGGIPEG